MIMKAGLLAGRSAAALGKSFGLSSIPPRSLWAESSRRRPGLHALSEKRTLLFLSFLSADVLHRKQAQAHHLHIAEVFG